MTANDLSAWQQLLTFSNSRAAKAIGVKTTEFVDMLDGRTAIDRKTALACAAVAAGLEPWGTPSNNMTKQLRPKRQHLLPVHD